MNNKDLILMTGGVIGGVLSSLFGGWDAILQTLLIFMAIDYITGIIVAGVFKNSTKTPTGRLDSYSCWTGLARKGMTLVIILVATRLDLIFGSSFIRDSVCTAYIVNEIISIVENAGLMNLPVPSVIKDAIEKLHDKTNHTDQGADSNDDSNQKM